MATDWLGGCTRQDFGTNGGSWTRQPAVIVLHSTEGGSWPGYDGGSSAPHFTIHPSTGERRQHISMGVAGRALANPSGGVETNRGGAIQIEMIGTCDPDMKSKGWPYMPGLNSTQLANVGRLMRDIANARGIAWRCGVTFKAYPGSYGSNGVRLSGSAWGSYTGVCGHQHVPENDHGDPGNIDIAALMGVAPSPSPTPPPAGKAPAFPLPSGHYFGPKSGPDESPSGYYNTDDDRFRPWQSQMAERGWTITADGLYGPQSDSVATQFQQEKGLGVDGLIGSETWGAAWTEPVT